MAAFIQNFENNGEDYWNKNEDYWNKRDDYWKKEDYWNKQEYCWNKKEKQEEKIMENYAEKKKNEMQNQAAPSVHCTTKPFYQGSHQQTFQPEESKSKENKPEKKIEINYKDKRIWEEARKNDALWQRADNLETINKEDKSFVETMIDTITRKVFLAPEYEIQKQELIYFINHHMEIVDKSREKTLNHERILNFQENIIECEENVAPYPNLPFEKTEKEGKTRRRPKPSIFNLPRYHCHLCKHQSRTVTKISTHITAKHPEQLSKFADMHMETTDAENYYFKQKSKLNCKDDVGKSTTTSGNVQGTTPAKNPGTVNEQELNLFNTIAAEPNKGCVQLKTKSTDGVALNQPPASRNRATVPFKEGVRKGKSSERNQSNIIKSRPSVEPKNGEGQSFGSSCTLESTRSRRNEKRKAVDSSNDHLNAGVRFENAPNVNCFANAATNLIIGIPRLNGWIQDNHRKGVLTELNGFLSSRNDQLQSTKILREKFKLNTGSQEDASEFLNMMITSMFEEVPSKPRSELDDMITTVVEEHIECINQECAEQNPPNIKDRVYPNILTVPLNNADTVDECLRLSLGTELIERRCPLSLTCKSQCARVTTTFKTLPPVLILNLLRFNKDLQKISKKIKMPLVIQPLPGGASYNLCSATVHIGNTMRSGHYVTYIRDTDTGEIVLCDDETVRRVGSEALEKMSDAYIVCYTRADHPEQKKTRLDQEDLNRGATTFDTHAEGSMELPTPPYTCKRDNVVQDEDTEKAISKLIDLADEKLVKKVIEHLGVTPNKNRPRLKGQLRTLVSQSSNKEEIRRLLVDSSSIPSVEETFNQLVFETPLQAIKDTLIKFNIKPNNHKSRWLGQLRGYFKKANQKETILEHLKSLKRTEASHRNKGTNSSVCANGNEQNKGPSKKSNAEGKNEMTKKTDKTGTNVIVRGGQFFGEHNKIDNKHELIDLMQKQESVNEFSRLIDDAEEKVIDYIYKEISIKPETHVGRRKQKLCKMLIDGEEREKILALLEQGQCYKNIRKITEASDQDTISVILNDFQIKPQSHVERRREQLYQAFLQSQEKDKIARLLIHSSRYRKVKAVIDATESIIIRNTLAQLQIEPDNNVDRRKLQLWTLYLKSAEIEKERIFHILDDMKSYTRLSTRLSGADETVIDCIMSKLMIQPDIHVQRRKEQILNTFITSSCKNDLFDCINEIIDQSRQYDILNKKLSEASDFVVESILTKLHIDPDTHVPRRKLQILEHYNKYPQKDKIFRWMNEILDIASQYYTLKKKLSEANDIVVQSILKKINVNADVNVPRRKYQILQYFMENSSKKKTLEIIDEVLRGDDILTLIDNASQDVVTDILKKLNKAPNKRHGLRRNQLIKVCLNSKDKMKILEMLKNPADLQIQNKNAEASYENDFLPDNIAEILEKQEILKNIRAQRVEGLETGQFNLLNQESVNPIFEAGADVSELLSKIKYDTCKICKERWPEMSVGPKSGKCHRCSTEKVHPGIPYTFSRENDMDPGQQPECLKILNTVEVAAISLRCPMLCVYKLKGGATGLKGHSISFPQDVQGFVNRLPRRPEDLPIVIIKAPKQQVPLRANRIKMLNALEFLIGNNPHYADITIDQDSLNMYPSNSQEPLSNVRTIDSADIPQTSSDEAETTEDAYGNPADHELVESLAQCQVPGKGIDEQIRTAVGAEQEQVTLEWPERHNRPASEWEPGYFSMAFPNLFPYGAGDITKPRIGKNPEFLAYLRHLTRLEDNRFAVDPRFLLHTISMYRRHKALTLGNVYATNVCNNMSMAELKQKVQEDDEAVMKSLTLFSAQIPGTKGYFSQEAKKAAALEKWLRITSNGEEMFNVFLTFSMPDRHINELHRLLPGSDAYLNKKVIQNLSEIPPDEDPDMYIDEKTDYMLRSRALNQNGGIVDWFAQKNSTY